MRIASTTAMALGIAAFLTSVHAQAPSAPDPYRLADGWAQLPGDVQW